MTSNWFPVLERIYGSRPLPVRLFSVGSRFRREQRQDPHHLFESTSASIVVMDRVLTMEDGTALVRDILNRMGFKKTSFVKKKIASRYYDPETDTEIFVKYEGQQVEVGNLGFYAPTSLANYNIDIPVFNIGFGVERMAMILGGAKDLRALVFPQFYEEVSFSDSDIAGLKSHAAYAHAHFRQLIQQGHVAGSAALPLALPKLGDVRGFLAHQLPQSIWIHFLFIHLRKSKK